MRRRALSEATQLKLSYFDFSLGGNGDCSCPDRASSAVATARAFLFSFFFPFGRFFFLGYFCEVSPITCGGKRREMYS